MVNFETITGPAWAASYLVNGDDSGLDPDERAKVDAWMRREGVAAVHDVARLENGEAEEERFTWHGRLHFPEGDVAGLTVCDYIVTLQASEGVAEGDQS